MAANDPINPDPALRSVGLDPAQLPHWNPEVAPRPDEARTLYAEYQRRMAGEATDPQSDRQAAQFAGVQEAVDNARGVKDGAAASPPGPGAAPAPSRGAGAGVGIFVAVAAVVLLGGVGLVLALRGRKRKILPPRAPAAR